MCRFCIGMTDSSIFLIGQSESAALTEDIHVTFFSSIVPAIQYDFEVQNARNRVYDRYRITSLRQVNHAQTVGLGQSGKGSRTDSFIQQTALQALSHLNRALPIP